MHNSNVAETAMRLLQALLPALKANYERLSPLRSSVRAQKALHDLATLDKTCESVDNLMVSSNVDLHWFQ